MQIGQQQNKNESIIHRSAIEFVGSCALMSERSGAERVIGAPVEAGANEKAQRSARRQRHNSSADGANGAGPGGGNHRAPRTRHPLI